MKLKKVIFCLLLLFVTVCNLQAQTVSSNAASDAGSGTCVRWETRTETVTETIYVQQCGYVRSCNGRSCSQVWHCQPVPQTVTRSVPRQVCVEWDNDDEEEEPDPGNNPNPGQCTNGGVACEIYYRDGTSSGRTDCCNPGQICGTSNSSGGNSRYCCTPNSGSDCEEACETISPCDANPCDADDTCAAETNEAGCFTGYSCEKNCDTNNPCDAVPCGSDEVCTPATDDEGCYTGHNCEPRCAEDTSPCGTDACCTDEQTCNDDGQCEDLNRCASSETECGTLCCTSQEICAERNDSYHCDLCLSGISCNGICCSSGEECVDGQCQEPCASEVVCDGNCCDSGQICIDNQCTIPSEGCEEGYEECGGGTFLVNPPQQYVTCCGPEQYCEDPATQSCRRGPRCEDTETRCGQNCCDSESETCNEGTCEPIEEPSITLGCPDGTTECGFECCNQFETCNDDTLRCELDLGPSSPNEEPSATEVCDDYTQNDASGGIIGCNCGYTYEFPCAGSSSGCCNCYGSVDANGNCSGSNRPNPNPSNTCTGGSCTNNPPTCTGPNCNSPFPWPSNCTSGTCGRR